MGIHNKVSPEIIEQMKDLFLQGKNFNQISAITGFNRRTVADNLKKNFSGNFFKSRVDSNKAQDILQLWELGISCPQIAIKTGFSVHQIRRTLKQLNVDIFNRQSRLTLVDLLGRMPPNMELVQKIPSKGYLVRCKMHPAISYTRKAADIHSNCELCFPVGTSQAEQEINNWIKSLDFSTEKIYLDGKEIDIYIPSLKLGIEYCGLYWHSDLAPVPKYKLYHLNKLNLANQNGIRLITIFEDEWLNRKEQVKGFLLSVLGKNNNKIDGRKCTVKEVPFNEIRLFLKQHHIQGSVNNISIGVGIFFQQQMIGVLTLSSHHRCGNRKKDEIVLSRLCFSKDYSVRGGASKMFKYAKSTAKMILGIKKIISWSDNRWSEGNVYKQLGFDVAQNLKPDYSYTMTTLQKRLSKQSMKKKNKQLLTEEQMRKSLNLGKIWDCGKKRWEYEL